MEVSIRAFQHGRGEVDCTAWTAPPESRGAHPSTLPVKTLECVTLIVNLKEARAQRGKPPQTVLLRADEFIE